MAKRYSGDLTINVVYDDRNFYRTSVSRGGKVIWRGKINPAPAGFGRGVAYDSAEAYDEIARSALAFADNDLGHGDISDHAEFDVEGWKVRRVPRYWEQYPGGRHRPKRFARRDISTRRDHLPTPPGGHTEYVIVYKGRTTPGEFETLAAARSDLRRIRYGAGARIEERAYDRVGKLVERKVVWRWRPVERYRIALPSRALSTLRRPASASRDEPKEKVSWYTSRLRRGGPSARETAWPVRVLRTSDGFTYVRGLAGRFKGREFSTVSNQVTSYLPRGAKIAPGASAYRPKVTSELKAIESVWRRIERIPSSERSVNPHVSPAQGRKLLDAVVKVEGPLRKRTPDDIGWRYFDRTIERAEDHLDRGDTQYALADLASAIGTIRGAIEREQRPRRDERRRR